jgi:diguanylate cyclase (GGDEF)-like protein
MIRTEHQDRVVTILDKNLEPQYFTISVSKSENSGDYLVTLSDITKMKLQQIENEKKASLDPLTNIYNRQKFDDVFNQEIKNTNRYGYSLSLAIIDIDKFKDFNDTYGHLVGDEVLVSTAQVVQKNLRETDIFARWGGEEFVILFRNTNISQAKIVCEKLRKRIENNTHQTARKVTVSFGLTQHSSSDTCKSMFKRCDEALYFAKENGRNRVEVF